MKYALIGEKLGHSYSKIIHEKYFAYKGISSTYDLIEIPKDNLSHKIASMGNEGYVGFNVTIPYKIDVMNMCDEVYDDAKKVGSVNTVKFSDDKMLGFNTDYQGLKLALRYSGVSLSGKDAVILGTGGASRAVVALCEDLGCKSITLVSRTPKSGGVHRCVSYDEISSGDVIINSTPVGMYPKTDASPFCNFEGFETAVDLIYNPAETLFLKNASEHGLTTVNGLYMLVAQALYSQSIWRETEIDFDIIDKIYRELRGFSL